MSLERDISDENPILSYYRWIIFDSRSGGVIVKTETGEQKLYTNYKDLEQDFGSGAIFPTELKRTLALEINELLQPVHRHFIQDEHAAKILADVLAISK